MKYLHCILFIFFAKQSMYKTINFILDVTCNLFLKSVHYFVTNLQILHHSEIEIVTF